MHQISKLRIQSHKKKLSFLKRGFSSFIHSFSKKTTSYLANFESLGTIPNLFTFGRQLWPYTQHHDKENCDTHLYKTVV